MAGFFTGAGLPLFLIGAAVVYEGFLLLILFGPEGATGWGGFAREFKQWCFSYNPRTGGMEWAAAVVMLIEPLFITLIAAFLWRSSLKQWKNCRSREGSRALLSGGVVAGVVVMALFTYGRPTSDDESTLPFPGERIRTALTPPEFQLLDQKGKAFNLDQERGRVTLITGVYALCGSTCPTILMETKSALDSLPPESRDYVTVVALSLNPENETAELMDRMVNGYGFEYPQFRYVNGEPRLVYETLRNLGFSRSVEGETGVINHSNLFLLVDAEGKIAYRLSLGGQTDSWLAEGVAQLVEEARVKAQVAEVK